MGANQTGGHKPVGTDFKKNKADREKYGDVDIPDIPLNKLKEVCAEVDMTVKQSKYLVEYKREARDALKRKKAKGHEPKLFRLYDKCLHPADDAAGKDEDRKGLIKLLTENITPVVKDDIIDGFKVDGKEGNLEKEADKTIHRLIHERVHDLIHETAESIFRKYLKGLNYEESDGEDEQDEAEKEEARAERAKQAAKQREYEAELWYAEMHGEEPPPKPTADEDDEEEEEESDEE